MLFTPIRHNGRWLLDTGDKSSLFAFLFFTVTFVASDVYTHMYIVHIHLIQFCLRVKS